MEVNGELLSRASSAHVSREPVLDKLVLFTLHRRADLTFPSILCQVNIIGFPSGIQTMNMYTYTFIHQVYNIYNEVSTNCTLNDDKLFIWFPLCIFITI